MSTSRFAAVLRSSVSPSSVDRMRLSLPNSPNMDRCFSTSSPTSGFLKKIWSGEGVKPTEAKENSNAEELTQGESVVGSNLSTNSSAAPALKHSPPANSRSSSGAQPSSRRPAASDSASHSRRPAGSSGSASAAATAPIPRSVAPAAGLRQQLPQRTPPSTNRPPLAQQPSRPERNIGGGSLNRQQAKSSPASSTFVSRASSASGLRPSSNARPAALNAPRTASTPMAPRTAAAPLRVAIQRARIDKSNAATPRPATAAASTAPHAASVDIAAVAAAAAQIAVNEIPEAAVGAMEKEDAVIEGHSEEVAVGSDSALKEGDAVDIISDAIPSCSSDLAADSIQPIVECQLIKAAVADIPEAAVVAEASAEIAAEKEEALGVSFESATVAEVKDQVEASEISAVQEAGVSPSEAAEGSQVEFSPEAAVEEKQESGSVVVQETSSEKQQRVEIPSPVGEAAAADKAATAAGAASVGEVAAATGEEAATAGESSILSSLKFGVKKLFYGEGVSASNINANAEVTANDSANVEVTIETVVKTEGAADTNAETATKIDLNENVDANTSINSELGASEIISEETTVVVEDVSAEENATSTAFKSDSSAALSDESSLMEEAASSASTATTSDESYLVEESSATASAPTGILSILKANAQMDETSSVLEDSLPSIEDPLQEERNEVQHNKMVEEVNLVNQAPAGEAVIEKEYKVEDFAVKTSAIDLDLNRAEAAKEAEAVEVVTSSIENEDPMTGAKIVILEDIATASTEVEVSVDEIKDPMTGAKIVIMEDGFTQESSQESKFVEEAVEDSPSIPSGAAVGESLNSAEDALYISEYENFWKEKSCSMQTSDTESATSHESSEHVISRIARSQAAEGSSALAEQTVDESAVETSTTLSNPESGNARELLEYHSEVKATAESQVLSSVEPLEIENTEEALLDDVRSIEEMLPYEEAHSAEEMVQTVASESESDYHEMWIRMARTGMSVDPASVTEVGQKSAGDAASEDQMNESLNVAVGSEAAGEETDLGFEGPAFKSDFDLEGNPVSSSDVVLESIASDSAAFHVQNNNEAAVDESFEDYNAYYNDGSVTNVGGLAAEIAPPEALEEASKVESAFGSLEEVAVNEITESVDGGVNTKVDSEPNFSIAVEDLPSLEDVKSSSFVEESVVEVSEANSAEMIASAEVVGESAVEDSAVETLAEAVGASEVTSENNLEVSFESVAVVEENVECLVDDAVNDPEIASDNVATEVEDLVEPAESAHFTEATLLTETAHFTEATLLTETAQLTDASSTSNEITPADNLSFDTQKVEVHHEASSMDGGEYDLQGFQGEWTGAEQAGPADKKTYVEISEDSVDASGNNVAEVDAGIAVQSEAAPEVAAVEVKEAAEAGIASQSEASAEAAEAEAKDAAESGNVLAENTTDAAAAGNAIEGEKTAEGEKVAAEKLSTIGWIKSIFKSR